MKGLLRPTWEKKLFKGINMTMLELDKVNVSYGKIPVLWDVSLKVNEGEIVALVGPNAAGKTTTLRTISGLLSPTSGKIFFLGKKIDNLPPHHIVEMGIAHIPEGKRIFPRLTVLNNLRVGAYRCKSKKEEEENLKYVFKLFPILEERKNQIASKLSGGEQQMLSIGRGLMSKPKLLMLDEPSLGLAPKLVLEFFKVINGLNKEGITILIVEQYVFHALKLAHRAYVLERGRIVMEGMAKEILESEHIKKAYLI
jgi:branched-chain amino acid transport system ATP-binding protein